MSTTKTDEVAVGTTRGPWELPPLTRTDIVRYQGASLDLNPIHHDDAFAQRGGYPTAFGVGMYQAGVLGTFVAEWFGPEAVRRFSVRFKEQVWPGDILVFEGRVAEITEEDGERRAEVELTCTRKGGGVAVAGKATVVLA